MCYREDWFYGWTESKVAQRQARSSGDPKGKAPERREAPAPAGEAAPRTGAEQLPIEAGGRSRARRIETDEIT